MENLFYANYLNDFSRFHRFAAFSLQASTLNLKLLCQGDNRNNLRNISLIVMLALTWFSAAKNEDEMRELKALKFRNISVPIRFCVSWFVYRIWFVEWCHQRRSGRNNSNYAKTSFVQSLKFSSSLGSMTQSLTSCQDCRAVISMSMTGELLGNIRKIWKIHSRKMDVYF